MPAAQTAALSFAFVAACSLGTGEHDDALYAAAATGDGLRATYFDEMNLTTPRVDKTDSAIDFDWGLGAPTGVTSDSFSVRWVGFVQPRFSQTYSFHVTCDDGARLRVNGQSLVDAWKDRGPETTSGAITLEAGVRYPIELVYYENTGGAMVRLEWSSGRQRREVIPRAQLYATRER